MKNLIVQYHSAKSLKPDSRNPRQHEKKQIQQIAASIKRFGFNAPILIDKNLKIIAGHGRLLAAKDLGLESVPVISVEHLSEAEARAFAIADNKLTENAKWNKQLLGEIYLELQDLELDFSLDVTGFDLPQIEILIENAAPETQKEKEAALPEIQERTISQIGDVWQLGTHRIYCGDALEEASYQALMGDQKAQMVFTDAPYNVPIHGHVCGLGKKKHAEFAEAVGEKSSEEFTSFLSGYMKCLCQHSKDGSLHFHCMDWRHDLELRLAAKEHYHEHKNTCVWVKDNGGMGSLYRSQHELIFVFKHGKKSHINNIQLGQYGRYRTNIWEYAGYNSFAGKNDGEGNLLESHPTVKPVALVADAIKDCTHKNHIVLDCFLGSGSTLIAAEKTGRVCYGIELEPRYIDLAIRRWQALTGKQAVHVKTGMSFDALAKERETGHDQEI